MSTGRHVDGGAAEGTVTLRMTHNAEDADDETSYDVVLGDGTAVGSLCVWDDGRGGPARTSGLA